MKDLISGMCSLLDGRTVACGGNLWLVVGSHSTEPVSLPLLVELGWVSLSSCRWTECLLCEAYYIK